LSQVYTNHSIEATGATLLSNYNFSSINIVAVTGDTRKLEMSAYLGDNMASSQERSSTISSSKPSQVTSTITSQTMPGHKHHKA